MADLFRKAAMQSASSREGLDRGVRAIAIPVKLFTALIAVAVSVFILWLLFSTVHETLTVDGILWSSENNVTVSSGSKGYVEKIVVQTGQQVNAGDLIAIIPREDLLKEIHAAKQDNLPQAAIDDLYIEYDRLSLLRANKSGVVVEKIPEKTYVNEGDKIAVIMPHDSNKNDNLVIAYVPLRQSAIIAVGMDVQISPEQAPREEYGYVNAYVFSVDKYPMTGSAIKAVTNSNAELKSDENYVKIEVILKTRASASSNLDWSTKKGEDIDIGLGTMCKCSIIIKKCRPYEWIF